MRSLPFAILLCLAVVPAGVAQSRVKEQVDKAIQTLKTDKDAKNKQGAIDELAKVAAVRTAYVKPALPVLIEAVKTDSDNGVKTGAIRVLAMLESEGPQIAPALIAALDEKENREVRMAAARAVGPFGITARDALPLLDDIRKKEEAKGDGKDQDLLNSANEGLNSIREAVSGELKKHMEAVKAKDTKERKAAVEELIRLSTTSLAEQEPIVETLTEVLVRDQEVEIFQMLTRWLKTSKPDTKKVVAKLVALLDEKEREPFRIAAVTTLGGMRADAKDALGPLTQLVQREKARGGPGDKTLLNRAEQAIEKIQAAVKAKE